MGQNFEKSCRFDNSLLTVDNTSNLTLLHAKDAENHTQIGEAMRSKYWTLKSVVVLGAMAETRKESFDSGSNALCIECSHNDVLLRSKIQGHAGLEPAPPANRTGMLTPPALLDRTQPPGALAVTRMLR
ncbi:unnamed protein product [Heligmosomoides polygyrus]|uniref:Uncharacterized protein n=1 Tax=Heligmosomoides polygyrus TaxID=6339 RepID=A0A183G379_HELPZ|nr:unnamed protein product [Heligmosomoides polygyrus]